MSQRRLVVALAVALAAAPLAASAQYMIAAPPPPRGGPELTAFAGYQLNTDVSTYNGHLGVSDTGVYGAAINTEVRPGYRAEFLWLYSEPTVQGYGYQLNGTSSFKVATHYFQLGGIRGFKRGNLEPFAGGTIGAVLFVPGDIRYANGSVTNLSDTWRFGFTLGGGLKIHFTENVAARLEFRVAAPVYFSGGSFYVGSGGAGVGVSGGIPVWQFNFLGGLVLGK